MFKPCPVALRYFLLGLFLAAGGSVLTNWWPSVYKGILNKIVELKPGNLNYDMWKSPPVPIFMDFYFFNWTNPEDFLVEGKKPHFVEIGPYRFIETKEKKDVIWNPNYTISFKQERVWFFDETSSVGSLGDQITTLNVVALSAAYVTRHWNLFALYPLNIMLRSQPLAVTHNVSELLFEGYSDTLITMAQVSAVFNLLDGPSVDRFAWFYKRNGSEDFEGVYNMRTGEDDIAHVAELVQWEYSNRTSNYADGCDHVGGSMGERFPPGRKKAEPLAMYSKEICRSVELDFTREEEVEGITGYRYEGTSRILDNGTLVPSNECFCGGSCVPSGVLNISTCQFGSPSFVSFPHFHLADPSYLRGVDGLSPHPAKHSFYAIIEPTTGLPLDVVGRLQVNILVQPYPKLKALERLPTVFFPMLWFEERATITPRLALYVKLTLLVSPLGLSFSVFFAICGVCLLTAATAKYYKSRKDTGKAFARSGDVEIQPISQLKPLKVYSPTTPNLQDEDEFSRKLLHS